MINMKLMDGTRMGLQVLLGVLENMTGLGVKGGYSERLGT